MTSPLQTSKLTGLALAVALSLVGSFEGVKYIAYRDPVGIPTICFGYTHGVRLGDTATPEQCQGLLESELQAANADVDRCIRRDITPGQRAALVSLRYNAGPKAVCGSTVQKEFNAGRFMSGCKAILKWTYSRGIELPGLVRRRQAEYKVCIGEPE